MCSIRPELESQVYIDEPAANILNDGEGEMSLEVHLIEGSIFQSSDDVAAGYFLVT